MLDFGDGSNLGIILSVISGVILAFWMLCAIVNCVAACIRGREDDPRGQELERRRVEAAKRYDQYLAQGQNDQA